MSNRRRLLVAFGAAAMGPRATLAQVTPTPAPPGKPVRVGILSASHSTARHAQEQVVFAAMRDLGWVEGRTIVYDRVYADGDESRLPGLAATLVNRRPDLILVTSNKEAVAVFGNTRTIPTVFASVAEPIKVGLVQSLAHPGGNVTGVANIGWELGGKRLQLLKQAMPRVSRVGALVNPRSNNSSDELRLIEQAATTAGIRVVPAMAKHADEFEMALTSLSKDKAEALIVTHIAFYVRDRKRILDIAAKYRIPVVAPRNELADDGALMSYSSILNEQIRRSAQLADKILKGAKPADIPVEQPTKYELVVNLKTAKVLGLTIPQSFLLLADRVIE